jgi:hypothetical protein
LRFSAYEETQHYAQASSSTCEQANGKSKKAKTAKITSWSIRADVVRKLDHREPELETVASGSGVASAPARFSKLYFPVRRQGRGFESRRSRQFPSAVGILKRQKFDNPQRR